MPQEQALNNLPHQFSVAPMMDWTDRHCRAFHRQLTRHALLYTEMLTAGAVIHGDRDRLLGYSDAEHPVALQLGGSEPQDMAEAARIGEAFGYDEININVGCPSDRVQSGRFGACLMAEPETVASVFAAMQKAVRIPVTVKCRIGIDDSNPETGLDDFVDRVADAGCGTFIVHARKAWLKGLSPKENRDIPPLDYDRVHRLKARRPDLTIVINGGIETLEDAKAHLAHVDGAMLGRAAFRHPGILAGVDPLFFDAQAPATDLREAVRAHLPYVEAMLAKGTRLSTIVKPMTGLFQSVPGARRWRQILTVESVRLGAGIEVIEHALAAIGDSAEADAA